MLRDFQTSPLRRRPFAAVALISITLTTVGLAGAENQKRTYSDEELATVPAPGPNPYLSLLPADAEIDWAYWQAKTAYESRQRANRKRAASTGNTSAWTATNR